MDRFPPTGDQGIAAEQTNPAIRIYGRRFYKDQTPVEYLAEFLLVFASPKGDQQNGTNSLRLEIGDTPPRYWPDDRVALKLFAFYPSSKLETRHPVHQKAYLQALTDIKARVSGTSEDKDEAVRLLQSLFAGFVGVAKNRTWVTHSFLPASSVLLAREVDWLHSRAVKNANLQDWDAAKQYFATDRHNFMARGGELLFLQLAHLFSYEDHASVDAMRSSASYEHLAQYKLVKLREDIEIELQSILEDAVGPISELASFIEKALGSIRLYESSKPASLGWVPTASVPEAFLFASELNNICRSTLGALEKIDLLQTLSCMQVLRSLCFQASRVDGSNNSTDGFGGGYSWIVADANAQSGSPVRKLAQSSFERIEEMLFRVLRQVSDEKTQKFNEADKHGFQIFRKIAKELGLVIPRTGRGQRFVLHPHLLRFLVAALIEPGERVRLTEFYRRVFAHYGIALGDQQLLVAMLWSSSETGTKDYAVAADTSWVEEALQQGGFLVELSDAVSIVHNPGSKE
ncbi:MAG: hypothetical protein KUF72_00370 [Candidatus Thiodiazotropha sp. (ex Ctena orbiculata)]|nr:hypothetical protein [Candidatus Thiodiazotropha taylori]